MIPHLNLDQALLNRVNQSIIDAKNEFAKIESTALLDKPKKGDGELQFKSLITKEVYSLLTLYIDKKNLTKKLAPIFKVSPHTIYMYLKNNSYESTDKNKYQIDIEQLKKDIIEELKKIKEAKPYINLSEKRIKPFLNLGFNIYKAIKVAYGNDKEMCKQFGMPYTRFTSELKNNYQQYLDEENIGLINGKHIEESAEEPIDDESIEENDSELAAQPILTKKKIKLDENNINLLEEEATLIQTQKEPEELKDTAVIPIKLSTSKNKKSKKKPSSINTLYQDKLSDIISKINQFQNLKDFCKANNITLNQKGKTSSLYGAVEMALNRNPNEEENVKDLKDFLSAKNIKGKFIFKKALPSPLLKRELIWELCEKIIPGCRDYKDFDKKFREKFMNYVSPDNLSIMEIADMLSDLGGNFRKLSELYQLHTTNLYLLIAGRLEQSMNAEAELVYLVNKTRLFFKDTSVETLAGLPPELFKNPVIQKLCKDMFPDEPEISNASFTEKCIEKYPELYEEHIEEESERGHFHEEGSPSPRNFTQNFKQSLHDIKPDADSPAPKSPST